MSIKDRETGTGSPFKRNKELTTLFTGQHCLIRDNVGSTSDYLAALLKEKELAEGTAVIAKNQTAGRGQRGSSWESENGKNLLVSFVFYPAFLSPQNVFLLNKAFALGLFDFVSNYLGKGVFVKWPNDIYYQSGKVCGMLIENIIAGSVLSQCILGVGININQTEFSQSVPNPLSFSMVTGISYDLDFLFCDLCSCLEARYLQLKTGGRQRIEQDYLSVLYGLREKRNFQSGGLKFSGTILGVDESGKLIVEKDSGEQVKFDLKEIIFC